MLPPPPAQQQYRAALPAYRQQLPGRLPVQRRQRPKRGAGELRGEGGVAGAEVAGQVGLGGVGGDAGEGLGGAVEREDDPVARPVVVERCRRRACADGAPRRRPGFCWMWFVLLLRLTDAVCWLLAVLVRLFVFVHS